MNGSVHLRTPDITAHDGRGLAIRQIACLRQVVGEPVQTRITRQRYNASGRLIEQWDPRLFDTGATPNLATVYSLSGQPLKVNSVDAGEGLSLPGLAGETLQRWDARASHWRTTYDPQLRVVAVAQNARSDVETFTYADASADPALNVRGQMIKLVDPAGWLELSNFSLQGAPLSEARTIADAGPYISSSTYSPLGAVLTQTDAGGHQQQSCYDIAGQLKQVQLRIKGHLNWQPVFKDAQYNAAGQIIEQCAGNDVLSTWTYDPADGRLDTQRAQKKTEPALQDFEYFYDCVGNITRIEDHTFQPIYFANQLVDGHRDFTYDSLYRLTSATGYDDAAPSDIPGRPLPGDPNNRLNYTQHCKYDRGGNLIELHHVRAGASHTREMCIDPTSNRGVRWKEGDPGPVFSELFDRHGNLQDLQPGKALQWNSLDQLEAVTLVKRDDGPNDQEFYRYSEGMRVYKRHETHTPSLTHFQEVIYLPGLEIRTRDNGEELHVITLSGGLGSVRCLHWVSGKPANIAADQLRYSLDDHLGSCALELDQNAQVISEEGYYPFGATAWYARGSEVGVDYKTVRYSGKEMDDSGLYYYGARYYAPWLQRWISADPAGDVDGLNLYAMVGGNPVRFIDSDGQGLSDFLQVETTARRDERKARSAAAQKDYRAKRNLSSSIDRHLQIVGISLLRSKDAQQQVLNHRSPADFAGSAARRTAVHVAGQAVAYGGGIAVGIGAQALALAAPGAGNVAGVALGFVAKKMISLAWDYAAERTGASASVKFKASRLSPEKIIKKAEYKSMSPGNYIQQKYAKMLPDTQKGGLKAAKEGAGSGIGLVAKQLVPQHASEVSATANTLFGAFEIAHEIAGAAGDLSDEKVTTGIANLTAMIDALNANMDAVQSEFETAGVTAMHTFSIFGEKAGDTIASLRAATDFAVNELNYTRTMLRSSSSKFTAV